MNLDSEIKKRVIWQQPWGYAEGFAIAIGLLLTGFMLTFFSNNRLVELPEWPYNLLLGVFWIAILVIIHFMYRKYPIVKFLSGIPASIGAIALFTALTLAMGFIPQTDASSETYLPLGLDRIRNSWPFLLASMYLLSSLGLVVLQKMRVWNIKNFNFLLSHLGLWIIIFAASLGSGDLQRFQINVEEGESTNIGYSTRTEGVRLPFEVKLFDFAIDEFPAKLALADFNTGKISEAAKNNLPLIEQNKTITIGQYKISVLAYYPLAEEDSLQMYVPSTDSFAAQAAKLKVYLKDGKSICEGWISSGSPTMKSAFLPVDSAHFLAMTLPEPRRFSSKIQVTDSKGKISKLKIEVNKPFAIDGWKIYQIGYDTKMGKYSKISILEAVRDPWIPVVYIGLFMLIAGAVFLFWTGRN